ncbi:Glutamate synthase [NADPH] large chain [hydrothermal vent metagenome]|uniref:Glutamate synthase [NADPH] large chain n=1 Tax=hydrothermal vent metagenome TaxID=652676 RepID=A0A1W1CSY7_9ZZZZ
MNPDIINIDITKQTLFFCGKSFLISSAKNGLGEIENSFCTPRGKHKIIEKIGDGALINTVFVGRKKTGEIYNPTLEDKYPNRDWILTRILWLEGCEVANRNSKNRYIYIHGTPDKVGVPLSHGCIRMNNKDIIELFDKVDVGTEVLIS